MNIKICFVTTSSVSIDSFILPTVPALEKHGFSVYFVTSCVADFEERCPNSVKVFDFSVNRGFDFMGTFVAARRFKLLCEQEKFDMVVYATPNGALYGSIGSKAAKVPCRVLAQWGMRYVGFEGWKRVLIRNIEKISCRNATDIRNVSEKNRLLAIKDGMYKPEKCKVLGLGGTIGVDLQNYDLSKIPEYRKTIREKFGIPQDSLTYAFVGRICRDKGVGELLQAFEKLQEDKLECYLMLIGKLEEDSQLSEEMLEKAKKNNRIVFCGGVANQKVAEYLSAADVLVHPTYREGFGMVLQEAAALKLPTITTNIIGASEAIVDGKTGLLAEKQDVETLKNAMLKMTDDDLRKVMGENGRKRIEESFERNMMVERICQDYLEIYNKRVLSSKKRK